MAKCERVRSTRSRSQHSQRRRILVSLKRENEFIKERTFYSKLYNLKILMYRMSFTDFMRYWDAVKGI